MRSSAAWSIAIILGQLGETVANAKGEQAVGNVGKLTSLSPLRRLRTVDRLNLSGESEAEPK